MSGYATPVGFVPAEYEYAEGSAVVATKRLEPQGFWPVTGFDQTLESWVIEAVAGGAGEFAGFASLQQVGEGVAEVATVEFAGLGQVAAVQCAATEIQFQCPQRVKPKAFSSCVVAVFSKSGSVV